PAWPLARDATEGGGPAVRRGVDALRSRQVGAAARPDRCAGLRRTARGRGALTWDLLAEGASVGTLRQALAGSLNVTLRSGALSGIDLRAALLEGRGELGKRAPAQQ